MHGTQIDIALSPAQAMLGELLAYVRRGDVQAVHSLRRGVAEALEIVARGDRKSSRVVGAQGGRPALPRRCAHRPDRARPPAEGHACEGRAAHGRRGAEVIIPRSHTSDREQRPRGVVPAEQAAGARCGKAAPRERHVLSNSQPREDFVPRLCARLGTLTCHVRSGPWLLPCAASWLHAGGIWCISPAGHWA